MEYEHCMPFFEDPNYEPPNGESPAMFLERVREAFAKLIDLEGDSDRHIGIVTHGMVCNDFAKVCLGYDPKEDPDFTWPNTCLTICDYVDGTWTVDTLACAAHLDEQTDGMHATGG
jgi:broad specificity phosphatase PhoE